MKKIYSFLERCLRRASKVFCEELVKQYPAYIFSQNSSGIAPHKTALTDFDKLFLHGLRNKHLGKRCFIIGNGPSLTAEDLDKLRFEYTFASNKIYLLFDKTMWRPTYYSCEDTLVVEQFADEILNIEKTTKIFPTHFLHFIERNDRCHFIDLHYDNNLVENDAWEERNFSCDLSRGIHWGSTITYSMMQMAAAMGFKEIYLLGLDHQYVLPKKQVHNFYIAEGETNHFCKEYRVPGEKWHAPRLKVLERSYAYAKEACHNVGITIYNASRKSALDIFEKVNLDDIL